MCLIVYLGQMLEIKVRVDLRRGDVGVAQEFLHAAQIMARFKQMRREGVAKQVRVDVGVDALSASPVTDAGLHGTGAQAAAPIAYEQGLFVACGELDTRLVPSRQGLNGLSTDRDYPVFVAFAGDTNRRIDHVHVATVETGQFRQTQSRGVQKLEYCAVAINEWAFA